MKFGMMMMDIPISGIHNCQYKNNIHGDWRVNNDNSTVLRLSDILHLLTDDIIETVDHDEIGWKGMHLHPHYTTDNCICCNGRRYKTCDIKYPGILSVNAPNPYNKKYRMIDGKHRIAKMLQLGISRSKFYVIEFKELIPFLSKLHG